MILNKEEYNKSLKEYHEKFGFSDYGIINIEKIKLICFICYLTQKLRIKDKSVMVIDLIEKIVPNFESYGDFLWRISFVCESLLHDGGVMKFPDFPTFGIKEPKDIIEDIRRILTLYLPF